MATLDSLASTYVNSLVHATLLFVIAVRKIRSALATPGPSEGAVPPRGPVTAKDPDSPDADGLVPPASAPFTEPPSSTFSLGARNCLAITMGCESGGWPLAAPGVVGLGYHSPDAQQRPNLHNLC